MCMTCGISVYLNLDDVTFEDATPETMRVIKNVFCPECGGPMGVIGKAGDQPFYRVP